MCNEPGCASAAVYLVDGRQDRGGRGTGFFAAYCEAHVQRFLSAANTGDPPGAPRKRTAAAGAGPGPNHRFA